MVDDRLNAGESVQPYRENVFVPTRNGTMGNGGFDQDVVVISKVAVDADAIGRVMVGSLMDAVARHVLVVVHRAGYVVG